MTKSNPEENKKPGGKAISRRALHCALKESHRMSDSDAPDTPPGSPALEFSPDPGTLPHPVTPEAFVAVKAIEDFAAAINAHASITPSYADFSSESYLRLWAIEIMDSVGHGARGTALGFHYGDGKIGSQFPLENFSDVVRHIGVQMGRCDGGSGYNDLGLKLGLFK